MAWRASRTQFGHSESVSRGQPSGGFTFCHDFCSGSSDHFGVKATFGLMLLRASNTVHAPLAATVSPFSTYLIGLCIVEDYLQVILNKRDFSEMAVLGVEMARSGASGRRALRVAIRSARVLRAARRSLRGPYRALSRLVGADQQPNAGCQLHQQLLQWSGRLEKRSLLPELEAFVDGQTTRFELSDQAPNRIG